MASTIRMDFDKPLEAASASPDKRFVAILGRESKRKKGKKND